MLLYVVCMCSNTHNVNFIAELEEFMRVLDQRHVAKAKKDKGVMAKTSQKSWNSFLCSTPL